MKLHLFTLATGIYNKYIPFLEKSLDNLYPVIEKTFNLISDKEFRLNLSEHTKYTESNYYHVCNLPYPFITLFKTQYIYDMINTIGYDKNDYMIFVDADSYFLDMGDDFYKKIFDDKIHLSISPWDKYAVFNWENDNNKKSVTYIDSDVFPNYSQTSIFFGRIDKFVNLNFEIMNLLSKDSYNHVLPNMPDQSLINKYLYDHQDEFVTDYYINNSYTWNCDDNNVYSCMDENGKDRFDWEKHKDTIFCIQKYLNHIKSEKRWSDKFEYDV